MAKPSANSGQPDQTLCSVASDLDLHCLPITLLGVSRLQWIKEDYLTIILSQILHKSICCWYSLEVPPQGTSNEYQQHMFLWRNKTNYQKNYLQMFLHIKSSYLLPLVFQVSFVLTSFLLNFEQVNFSSC